MRETGIGRTCAATEAAPTRKRIYGISLSIPQLPFPGPRWRVVHV
jgi:hypothetical protein